MNVIKTNLVLALYLLFNLTANASWLTIEIENETDHAIQIIPHSKYSSLENDKTLTIESFEKEKIEIEVNYAKYDNFWNSYKSDKERESNRDKISISFEDVEDEETNYSDQSEKTSSNDNTPVFDISWKANKEGIFEPFIVGEQDDDKKQFFLDLKKDDKKTKANNILYYKLEIKNIQDKR